MTEPRSAEQSAAGNAKDGNNGGSSGPPVRSWDALSDDQLKQIGVSFCRSRTRVDILHARDDDGRVSAGALCGRLVKALLEHRRSMRAEKGPNIRDLYRHATSPENRRRIRGKLDYSDIGPFLRGEPRKFDDTADEDSTHVWIDLAWVLTDLLLLGSAPGQAKVTKNQRSLAREIQDYFLRPKGQIPHYFARLRRTCRDPFTREEAYQGTLWLARRIELGQGTGVVVFTSGEPAFLQAATPRSEKFNDYGSVTVELARLGLDVFFVYPKADVVDPTPASGSAESFRASVDERLRSRIHLLDLNPGEVVASPEGGRKVWAGEFLDPTAILTYVNYTLGGLSTGMPQETGEDLYVTRTMIEEDDALWCPYAYLASAKEKQLFREWFFAFRQRKLGVPSGTNGQATVVGKSPPAGAVTAEDSPKTTA